MTHSVFNGLQKSGHDTQFAQVYRDNVLQTMQKDVICVFVFSLAMMKLLGKKRTNNAI